jgi:chromosome segregation ATPase
MSLDGTHAMNSSLQSKLVLEKKTLEVTYLELQLLIPCFRPITKRFSHP